MTNKPLSGVSPMITFGKFLALMVLLACMCSAVGAAIALNAPLIGLWLALMVAGGFFAGFMWHEFTLAEADEAGEAQCE